MATTIEYALMAGRSYLTTRNQINWFPVPDGWTEFFHTPDPNTPTFQATDGFEAISFTNGTEIVISFAGTYEKSADDWQANLALGAGNGSAQLVQAAEYYLQVKAANPNATITLTGHSLGGGLAALVGVFFGVEAHTFDQAPFANAAQDHSLNPLFNGVPDVAEALRIYLAFQLDANGERLYSDAALAGLTEFLQQRDSGDIGNIPNAHLVSNIRVDGELVQEGALVLFDTIGNPPHLIGARLL